ncbi:segregation/condensation protein A [Agrobacterium rubi]|nr:segregation/condensation protein A [Agrobacterium rubi]NTF24551.1 segregation/condensation protein A [Agrobacterium rubi]
MEDLLLNSGDDTFIVRFEAWEGPIEALLELARSQKLDLSRIDMLELVAQFEAVVDRAIGLRLELAADWLVMATWMTYLKSRILLRRPKENRRDEPDEDVLAYHLKRLNAVRTASERLPDRLQLGRDWYAPSGVHEEAATGGRLAVSLHDFIAAYPRGRDPSATVADSPVVTAFDVDSVDAAIGRITAALPDEWIRLLELVPRSSGLRLRSSIATSLIASLELARDGKAQIQQDDPSMPIMVRRTKS